MEIKRLGSERSAGPAEYSTGGVRVDTLRPHDDSGVTFEPDTRTAWHTHPLAGL